MEYAELAKSHGILLSVIEFYPFCPRIVFFDTTEKLSICVESPLFQCFLQNALIATLFSPPWPLLGGEAPSIQTYVTYLVYVWGLPWPQIWDRPV